MSEDKRVNPEMITETRSASTTTALAIAAYVAVAKPHVDDVVTDGIQAIKDKLKAPKDNVVLPPGVDKD